MRTHVVDLMYSPLGHDGSGSHANIFNSLKDIHREDSL